MNAQTKFPSTVLRLSWLLLLTLSLWAGACSDGKHTEDEKEAESATESQPTAQPPQPPEDDSLKVYTDHGWDVPKWTGNPALDKAMVLNTRRDTEEAFKAFAALDEQGVPTATAMLGRCYEEGRGAPLDSGQALVLYMKAREAGDAVGTYHYYRMTGKEYEEEAVKNLLPLLEKECANGNIIAKSLLAHWMLKHPDARNTWYTQEGREDISYFDYALALDAEAANAGYAPSQSRLAWVAEHYQNDTENAARWRAMAAKNNFPVSAD